MCLLVVLLIASIIVRLRKKATLAAKEEDPTILYLRCHHNANPLPPIFTYEELEYSTNQFDSKRQIKDNKFGSVYLDQLYDNRIVAVKHQINNCSIKKKSHSGGGGRRPNNSLPPLPPQRQSSPSDIHLRRARVLNKSIRLETPNQGQQVWVSLSRSTIRQQNRRHETPLQPPPHCRWLCRSESFLIQVLLQRNPYSLFDQSPKHAAEKNDLPNVRGVVVELRRIRNQTCGGDGNGGGSLQGALEEG
ncbi:LEAF RUST 10 DISEASE-RESISTANCE LOCUS RECEPTOR-LIKE PROTEIN KINASE-like 1.5 [Camellia lanceoleosa]|uniref:LEAF RUST 10 DISEASE-RESISTANCE LOCUS RECEPTOR-LIKE PROTEIN KINASE-like 1.5 n=1 Tax=Camellia lanceoleosa TaxID=1840588 RepID=A0ACC0FVT3_9ERIC|nr:LEAF RUST 10 DISEASE-RESISTANCE LOCUS RECEPTOR-LIKE PROTEIN KINASE-like 1.5 [Camellia lanceoleosa]